MNIKLRVARDVFLIDFTVWSIIYIFNAFSYWTLHNPLQWIIDMPTRKAESRFAILFIVLLYKSIILALSILFESYIEHKDNND